MFIKALWTLSSSLASSSGSASKCSQDQIDCLTSSSPTYVKSVSSETLASSFGNKPSEESEADLEEGRVDLICVNNEFTFETLGGEFSSCIEATEIHAD